MTTGRRNERDWISRPHLQRIVLRVSPHTREMLAALRDRYSITSTLVIERAVQALFDASHEPTPVGRPVVLIGEAPPARMASQPERWLLPDPKSRGDAGWRLLVASGLTADEYLALFERTYLLERPARDHEWPVDDARRAASVLRRVLPGRDVVLLGRRVQAAFGLANAPYLEWREQTSYGGRPMRVLTVPNPSGFNRWWNSPQNCQSARDALHELADRALARRPAPTSTCP